MALESLQGLRPTKVRLVKAMVFPVVVYGCEGWTIKKAECQRIDAFELWCWRRLLSPTPQFKSIVSLALSFPDGPTLTSIPGYWKKHSFD